MKAIIASCFTLLLITSVYTQTTANLSNTCSPECGGNGPLHCTDYSSTTSDPNNCISCSPGNIGGGPQGALCRQGRPAPGCTASRDSIDSTNCYVCMSGYYDPVQDPTKATPCKKCHSSCTSCDGDTKNNCFICADKFFDPTANPYTSGSCEPCDPRCTSCFRTATNCGGCCELGYVRDATGFCAPAPQ